MRISYDKESGALYIKLRDGEYDHTEDFSERADVYVDVDAAGNVLGLESLSFDDLAQAIEERGGELVVPERWDSLQQITRRTMVEALASLEPRQKELLQLRFYDGLNIRETSERLGISVLAAQRLQNQAIHKLREMLTPGRMTEEDERLFQALLATL